MSSLRRYASIEARLVENRWLWAEETRETIAGHWAERVAARPAMFNGRVLMVCGLDERPGGALAARFFATDYANLVAWNDGGQPGERVWNGFAMGALRGSDGAFVLGRMAAHTANSGRLYFPCGTPDLSDVMVGGDVDLLGSLTREIVEETGLGLDELRVRPGWIVVEAGGLLAFMRIVQLQETAEAVCARIRAHLATEERPELAAVETLAGLDGMDEGSMPPVLPIFLRDAFGTGAAAYS